MAVVVAVVNRRYRLTVTGSGLVPIPDLNTRDRNIFQNERVNT